MKARSAGRKKYHCPFRSGSKIKDAWLAGYYIKGPVINLTVDSFTKLSKMAANLGERVAEANEALISFKKIGLDKITKQAQKYESEKNISHRANR